jgi:uncharacterized membrane protein YkvA (DUF1232 family)
MALENWKRRVAGWMRETRVLYHACRDPRTPWYAKALGVAVIAYALSPVDLIPDFIPVIGWIDDLLIVPLGLLAVRAMIPKDVLAEYRAREGELSEPRR